MKESVEPCGYKGREQAVRCKVCSTPGTNYTPENRIILAAAVRYCGLTRFLTANYALGEMK